jgi:hypothetical protein
VCTLQPAGMKNKSISTMKQERVDLMNQYKQVRYLETQCTACRQCTMQSLSVRHAISVCLSESGDCRNCLDRRKETVRACRRRAHPGYMRS